MTEYLKKSFSVALGNPKYSDGWDRIFGGKECGAVIGPEGESCGIKPPCPEHSKPIACDSCGYGRDDTENHVRCIDCTWLLAPRSEEPFYHDCIAKDRNPTPHAQLHCEHCNEDFRQVLHALFQHRCRP